MPVLNRNRILLGTITSLPLINVLASMSVNMMSKDAFHFGDLRAILLFIIILVTFLTFRIKEKITVIMTIFLIYLFVLINFSSDFLYSFSGTYLKVFLTMMMFPVGFYFINSYGRLLSMYRSFLVAVTILVINYILAQIYNIGRSVYLEDSFYYGYAGIGSTVLLTYFVILSPLFQQKNSSTISRSLKAILLVSCAIITIVALKRTAIIALAGGYLAVGYFSGFYKNWRRTVIVGSILLVALYPLFDDVFESRLAARTTEDNAIENEARYKDVIYAVNDFRTRGLKHAVFGTELFNSPAYFGRTRQVHIDYANLLIGSGIVGLGLYLGIYLLIIRSFGKLYRYHKRFTIYNRSRFTELRFLRAVFLSLILASLIISFSGGIHVLANRGILFLFLGALYRYTRDFNTFKIPDFNSGYERSYSR